VADEIVPEDRKKELEFQINNFNQPGSKTDLSATAQIIENLIFLKKRTYADSPDMGIDIENYMFEFMDDSMLRTIETVIKEQIDTYIPQSSVKHVLAQSFTDPKTNLKILGIAFSISTSIDQEETFSVLIKQDKTKLVSKVVF
jgi:hypothetical protein